MPDVLLLSDDARVYRDALLAGGWRGGRLHVVDHPDGLAAAAAEARLAPVALARPGMLAAVLHQLPNLQWVQSTFAGVDALLAGGLRRDYRLTGVKGVFGPLMSEYVFGHLIARERGFSASRQAQRERRWQPLPYAGLGGRLMGIAGLGSIGRHLAATAAHFGLRVQGYRRSPGAVAGVERVYAAGQFLEFVRELDVLVLTLPATPETHGLMDASALSAMKPGALLVNVGRGSLVDEAALAAALAAGRPGAALLDVFEQEPLPEASPLWGLENCTITPHIAAASHPAEIARLFVDNWRRYQAGEALLHGIDFELGY